MANYACKACGRLLGIEGLNDNVVVMLCPVCRSPKDFRLVPPLSMSMPQLEQRSQQMGYIKSPPGNQPAPQPIKDGKQEVKEAPQQPKESPAKGKEAAPGQIDKEAIKKLLPEAKKLYDEIITYSGGQIATPLTPAEKTLYALLGETVASELRTMAAGNCNTRAVLPAEIEKLIAAADRSKKLKAKILENGSEKCLGFEITCFDDILCFIRMMGDDPQAETYCRMLFFNFPDAQHVVFLTAKDHYCWPLVLNGQPCDLQQYTYDYDKLMAYGITPEGQLEFLTTGGCWHVNQLGLCVANIICESDRNWNQLLLSLVLLALKGKSTSMAHQQGLFPMKGGGWKNHCTWGPGANPTNGSSGPTPDICRFMLRVLMQEQGSRPSTWQELLACLMSDQPAAIEHAQNVLKRAIAQLFKQSVGKIPSPKKV